MKISKLVTYCVVCCLFSVCAVCTAFSSIAHAQTDSTVKSAQSSAVLSEPRPWSVGLLVGNGFDQSKRLGLGVRAGYSLLDVIYLGGTVMWHAGTALALTNVPIPNSPPLSKLEVSQNSWYIGPEAGIDIMLPNNNLLRPYIGVGGLFVNSSSTVTVQGGSASPTSTTDSSPRLYAAPGLMYTLAVNSRYSIGADARYHLVTGTDGTNYSTFSAFLAITVRF